MKEQESHYIQKVEQTIGQETDAVKTICELTRLKKPSPDELSVNTQSLIEYVDNLELEREDGELDGGADDYDAIEQRIASDNLENIKRIVSDIKNGNWYQQIFWAELAYSNLQNDKYLYKLVHQKMDAKTSKEAEREMNEAKEKASRQHPDDPDFLLEDVRVNVEIIDSNGKPVEPQKFLLN